MYSVLWKSVWEDDFWWGGGGGSDGELHLYWQFITALHAHTNTQALRLEATWLLMSTCGATLIQAACLLDLAPAPICANRRGSSSRMTLHTCRSVSPFESLRKPRIKSAAFTPQANTLAFRASWVAAERAAVGSGRSVFTPGVNICGQLFVQWLWGRTILVRSQAQSGRDTQKAAASVKAQGQTHGFGNDRRLTHTQTHTRALVTWRLTALWAEKMVDCSWI